MKILLIAYNFGGTASGKITARIANEFIVQKCEVVAIVCERYSLQPIPEGLNLIECKNILKTGSTGEIIRTKILTILGYSSYNTHIIWRQRAIKVAKQLFKQWIPDWIYCRSTPIDSCLVGVYLKKQFSIKLYQHFSDPLPRPVNHEKDKDIVWRRFLRQTKYILRNSDLASYGTQEMIDFIQGLIPFSIKNKTFVSPDSVPNTPNIIIKPYCKNDRIILTYLGNIYGTRNPNPLIDAINYLNEQGLLCTLNIYSAKPLNQISQKYVNYIGYKDNVMEELFKSDILVDIDGDDLVPVFLSSKIKDYLIVSRPILSITPSNSPAANIFKHLKTIYITTNNFYSICNTIERIVYNMPSMDDYNERQSFIFKFNPRNVVRTIINQLENNV